MASNFQDDEREDGMRQLFNLVKDESEGRSGVDAHFIHGSLKLPFELKTTSNGSVTTVRDFGPNHIEKWKDKHWLIGFFEKGSVHYKYGSPEDMKGWIDGKAQYIKPDFDLAAILGGKVSLADLNEILGEKEIYTLKDAQSLQKKQLSKIEYLALQDCKNGYSAKRMLEILKMRATYIMNRGSTLNNPHIPASYFKG